MMRFVRLYLSRKYFQRILLTMSIFMIAVLVLTSFVLYAQSKKTILEMQKSTNRKILTQMNHNVNYMNEMVRNLATNLFMDPDVVVLTHMKGTDHFLQTKGINKLDKIVTSSSFVHSVSVYNSQLDEFYIGGSNARPYSDKLKHQLRKLMLREELPMLQLIPLYLVEGETKGAVDLFTMAFYETDRSGIRRAIFVSVYPKWLSENMENVNEAHPGGKGSLLILDGSGMTLDLIRMSYIPPGSLAEQIRNNYVNPSNQPLIFDDPVEGRQIVSYMQSRSNDWTIVSIQPYSELMQGMISLRKASFLITVLLLVGSVALSLFLSQKLYKPIESLLRQARRFPSDSAVEAEVSNKDEIAYLSDIYNRVVDRMETDREKYAGSRNLAKKHALRTLLTQSSFIRRDKFEAMLSEHSLALRPHGPYLVAIIRIDRWKELSREVSPATLSLYRFAVENITTEMLSAVHRVEAADVNGEYLALLIGSGGDRAELNYAMLREAITRAQDMVLSYYKISFTAALSDGVSEYSELAREYEAVQQLSLYRTVFGHGSVILPDMVRDMQNLSEMYLPPELERKLADTMKEGRLEEMLDTLDKTFELISRFSYDHMIHSITQLVVVIRQTLKEMNRNKLQPIVVDLRSIYQRILEEETLLGIRETFEAVFADVASQHKRPGLDKSDILSDTIKQHILENFTDPNLCLQGIADHLKMSSAYVGRVFRKVESMSVAEYINDVRLMQAQRLLEQKDCGVLEIMEMVGYINQSHFFRQFKKKFGATPREYQLSKVCS